MGELVDDGGNGPGDGDENRRAKMTAPCSRRQARPAEHRRLGRRRGVGDHVQGDAVGAPDEGAGEREAEHLAQPAAARLADDDLGHVISPGVVENGGDQIIAVE